jgi:hypothetical protein
MRRGGDGFERAPRAGVFRWYRPTLALPPVVRDEAPFCLSPALVLGLGVTERALCCLRLAATGLKPTMRPGDRVSRW